MWDKIKEILENWTIYNSEKIMFFHLIEMVLLLLILWSVW